MHFHKTIELIEKVKLSRNIKKALNKNNIIFL